MSARETARILDAAQQLLHSEGSGFTMDQLEEQVGLSRATLYRRVGSRASLLELLAAERNEDIDDTRQQILKATRSVIGREGMTGATIERVADEAGVGVATVYRHFETKDGLFTAFMEEMTPRPILRSLTANTEEDLAAELHEVVAALVGFVHELRDILRIAMFADEAERRYTQALRRRSDSSFHWLTAYFESRQQTGHLAPAAEPRDLALSLMGMVLSFGMLGPLHYDTPLSDPGAAADAITSVFLTGAATRP